MNIISAGGRRILQIAHNHPRFHPGGTELTALALHREALQSGIDSWYLGAVDGTQILPNQGTQMIALSSDQREAVLFADGFRRFALAQDDHFGFLREFRDYLALIRPDVVHVHHILNFGLEALHIIRTTLPKSRVILTLHDYYLICANNGQLYKHDTRERCPGPSLHECLKCLPDRRANEFAMRALDIRNALSLCDQVVAPSNFLKEKFDRYIASGQPISVIENGYLGSDLPAGRSAKSDATLTFGYFGNISVVKGLGDLLEAAHDLITRGIDDFRLYVYGSQLFEDKLLFDRMEKAKLILGDRLQFFGQYKAEDMRAHIEGVDWLVFPSVWWENAPLVIYEALYHRRQVISYPHGGAPEILSRYGMGLLAENSHPRALADAMQRVIESPSVTSMKPQKSIPARRQLLKNYGQLYFK